MSLLEKVEENRQVAEKCRAMKKFNTGASRAYYSAFQMAKHLLIQNNFDYDDFFRRNGKKEGEKAYSHRTILPAITECLSTHRSIIDLVALNVFDDLHSKRIKADYYDQMISPVEMENCLKDLEKVLEVLKA